MYFKGSGGKRVPENSWKMDLRQVKQDFSLFFAFCQNFAIFDDFSKFHSKYEFFLQNMKKSHCSTCLQHIYGTVLPGFQVPVVSPLVLKKVTKEGKLRIRLPVG